MLDPQGKRGGLALRIVDDWRRCLRRPLPEGGKGGVPDQPTRIDYYLIAVRFPTL